MEKALMLTLLLVALGVAVAQLQDGEIEGSDYSLTTYSDNLENGNEIPSEEELTGERGAEHEILVHLDDSLNEKYETILEECLFPDENDTLAAIKNYTEEYIFLRRRWFEFFKSSPPQNDSGTFYLDSHHFKLRDKQLNDAEYLLQSLKVKEIWKENSKMLLKLIPLSLKWNKDFDFQEGKNTSKTAEMYVEEFRSSLENLEESSLQLEKQRKQNSIDINCLNESIPKDYLKTARQTLRRKAIIPAFYKTVVIFGQTVEPILISCVFVLGMVLNCTMIYAYIRLKETDNIKNVMILNLAIIGVLRLVFELPLFYQQTYYSRYLVVGFPVFLAFHTLFVSLAAISVLILNVQYYIATSAPLHNPLCQLPTLASSLLQLLAVWSSAIGASGISIYFITGKDSTNILTYHMICLVMFGIIVPLILTVICVVTVQRLRSDVENGGGKYQHLDKSKRRQSKVASALCVAFFVSYILDFSRLVVPNFLDTKDNDHSVLCYVIERCLCYLFFCNVCIFPAALYIASSRYKKHFKSLLCKCCISKTRVTPEETLFQSTVE